MDGSAVSETDFNRDRKFRIVMYSHDVNGLGHVRRNLLIARGLSRSRQNPVILLITGIGEASALEIPPGADLLTLPAIFKGPDGGYSSRHLDITLPEIITLRAQTIRAALAAFQPDMLIVDYIPRGAAGELDPTLQYLQENPHCRAVLGLRDVIDDAATVEREWALSGAVEAIRHFYDAVWIYGDPAVYDPVREYRLPEDIAAKVRYTGYLGQSVSSQSGRRHKRQVADLLGASWKRFVLCCVGGGQDGARLAEAFAGADFPTGVRGVIVTGPFMPPRSRDRLRKQAADNPDLRVLGFVPQMVSLMEQAERVVVMGGYNTVCEILSFHKMALVVPRVSPRLEQWIRAERLRDMGLLDIIHPDEVSSAAISEWLRHDASPPANVYARIDMNGLNRVSELVKEMIAASPRHSPGEALQIGG